jgi:hypothetical protein
MSDLSDSSRKRKLAFPLERREHDGPARKEPRGDIETNNGLQDSPDSLCEHCSVLNFDAIFQTKIDKEASSKRCGVPVCNLGDLTSRASSSCPLCRLFAAVRAPTHPEKPVRDYSLRAFSVRRHFGLDKALKRLEDTVILGVLPVHVGSTISRRARRALRGGETGFIYPTFSSSQSHDVRLVGRLISPSSIDYQVIQGWLDFCTENHTSFCRQESPLSLHGFRVIDCSSRKIVCPGECCEYLALSYVWGTPSIAEPEDYEELPSPVCKVVEDTILVAKELGIQFIWVDRYCIRQNQASEKYFQIRNMDQIYARAKVTVIVSAAEDSSCGLPGVSDTHRNPQPSLIFGTHVLVSSMRNPQHLVKDSKWATRAWTFQEGTLSYRRLIFTEDQVLFECNSMACQETISTPLELLHAKGMQELKMPLMDRSLRLFTRGSLKDNPYSYFGEIEEYTTRSLSYQSDALNAIMGVFRSAETAGWEQGPIRQLWGLVILPDSWLLNSDYLSGLEAIPVARHHHPDLIFSLPSFGHALSWTVEYPLCRNREFPSWSWSGWNLPSGIRFPTSGYHNGNVNVWVVMKNGDLVRSFICYCNLILTK